MTFVQAHPVVLICGAAALMAALALLTMPRPRG